MIRSCLFPASLLCLTAFGCTKEQGPVSCTARRAPIPALLSFSGFTPQELNTLVIGTYSGGSNFAARIRQDTSVNDTVLIIDSKAYKNGFGFASLETGLDYQVYVPATAQTFKITGIQRTGDSLYRYTSNTTCNLKGTVFWSPDGATVNGTAQSLAHSESTPANYLYLPR